MAPDERFGQKHGKYSFSWIYEAKIQTLGDGDTFLKRRNAVITIVPMEYRLKSTASTLLTVKNVFYIIPPVFTSGGFLLIFISPFIIQPISKRLLVQFQKSGREPMDYVDSDWQTNYLLIKDTCFLVYTSRVDYFFMPLACHFFLSVLLLFCTQIISKVSYHLHWSISYHIRVSGRHCSRSALLLDLQWLILGEQKYCFPSAQTAHFSLSVTNCGFKG